jgi:hypothetical protein
MEKMMQKMMQKMMEKMMNKVIHASKISQLLPSRRTAVLQLACLAISG